jgi:hypothetical protein
VSGNIRGKKLALTPLSKVEAHKVLRRGGSHIFYTINPQMAVKLSALRAGRVLPKKNSWNSFLLEAELTGRAFLFNIPAHPPKKFFLMFLGYLNKTASVV